MIDQEQFGIQTRQEGKVRVLALKGTLDLNAAPRLKDELERDADKDKCQLVIGGKLPSSFQRDALRFAG